MYQKPEPIKEESILPKPIRKLCKYSLVVGGMALTTVEVGCFLIGASSSIAGQNPSKAEAKFKDVYGKNRASDIIFVKGGWPARQLAYKIFYHDDNNEVQPAGL